jgi:Fur family ferric uptake transcriptional regulator
MKIKGDKLNKGAKVNFGYSDLIRSMGMPLFFKNIGIKLTKPRERVLNVIFESKEPLTFDEIRNKLGKSDKTSIYRVLDIFIKNRIILKIDLRKESFFYEMNDKHHHHIVCNSCGDVEKFEECELPNPILNSKKFSFINDHSLEFFGKCKKCV